MIEEPRTLSVSDYEYKPTIHLAILSTVRILRNPGMLIHVIFIQLNAGITRFTLRRIAFRADTLAVE